MRDAFKFELKCLKVFSYMESNLNAVEFIRERVYRTDD